MQYAYSSFATTLPPGQGKQAPSAPVSGASWCVVSCGVRLLVVVLTGFRKPQVKFLSYQRNPLDFKAEEACQRRLDRVPSTKPSLLVPAALQAKPLLY